MNEPIITLTLPALPSANEAMRKPRTNAAVFVQRSCEICNTAFTAKPYQIKRGGGRYCSMKCNAESQRGNNSWRWKSVGQSQTTLTCEVCKKEFYKPPTVTRKGGGRFCSQPCRGKGLSGMTGPLWNQVQITCAYCSKEFWRRPAEIKAGMDKHCSMACWRKDQQAQRRICQQCGQPITGTGRKYCTVTCRSAWIVAHKELRPHSTKTQCGTCGKDIFTRNSHAAQGAGKFCSRDCVNKWRSANGEVTYSRGKGGRRADLNNRYFRSRWESNWARYLNHLIAIGEIAKWEYEIDTFEFVTIKRGSRFYTPDFKIHRTDGSTFYQEVKGWMTKQSKTKLARMSKYYPTITVEIVDKPVYMKVYHAFKNVLPNWEKDGNLG